MSDLGQPNAKDSDRGALEEEEGELAPSSWSSSEPQRAELNSVGGREQRISASLNAATT